MSTTILVAISILTQATFADCNDALKKCDVVVEKQDKLILIMKDRLDEVQDENEKLTDAVIRLEALSKNSLQTNLTWGVAGVALGVIAMSLVNK